MCLVHPLGDVGEWFYKQHEDALIKPYESIHEPILQIFGIIISPIIAAVGSVFCALAAAAFVIASLFSAWEAIIQNAAYSPQPGDDRIFLKSDYYAGETHPVDKLCTNSFLAIATAIGAVMLAVTTVTAPVTATVGFFSRGIATFNHKAPSLENNEDKNVAPELKSNEDNDDVSANNIAHSKVT